MTKAEQFIQDYTRNCSNELCSVEDRYGKKVISYHEWLTPEQALRAVELARKEMIEKAVEWLYQQLNEGGMECGNILFFVECFRKAMEVNNEQERTEDIR